MDEKFDLEKHKIFIQETPSHPNDGKGPWKYGGSGGSVAGWGNVFCPMCFSKNGYYHVKGDRTDMIWNECEDCGWIGGKDDCISKGEVTNRKRTKIIDRMLNESIV